MQTSTASTENSAVGMLKDLESHMVHKTYLYGKDKVYSYFYVEVNYLMVYAAYTPNQF